MNSLDTLSYCKRLEAAGMPREQAEVQAQILSQMATKEDLKQLEARTKERPVFDLKQQKQKVKIHDFVMGLIAIYLVQLCLIVAAVLYLPH
jgi:hypothetical protein